MRIVGMKLQLRSCMHAGESNESSDTTDFKSIALFYQNPRFFTRDNKSGPVVKNLPISAHGYSTFLVE